MAPLMGVYTHVYTTVYTYIGGYFSSCCLNELGQLPR